MKEQDSIPTEKEKKESKEGWQLVYLSAAGPDLQNVHYIYICQGYVYYIHKYLMLHNRALGIKLDETATVCEPAGLQIQINQGCQH